jgi:hypothetical protein
MGVIVSTAFRAGGAEVPVDGWGRLTRISVLFRTVIFAFLLIA